MEKRNCPICNSQNNKLLFQQSFSGFSDNNLLSGYDVVSCESCGFCYSDAIPGQDVFDVYYRELSKYESNTTELREGHYDRLRFNAIVTYLKPFLPDKKIHIAEVGCATGFLLSLLKKEGYENLTGIDPSPGCTEAAHRHYGLRVLTNTISNIELPPASVDLLLLVGVLEHVRDLDASLEKLWNLLKPGGRLLIVVPDGSEYYNGQDAPFQEFSVEHINFFGPVSLENLLKKNKFSKVHIGQQPFEVNYNTITPALLGLFQKETVADFSFSKDQVSTPHLQKYISDCTKKEEEINQVLGKIAAAGESLVVWGTGAQTLRLMANSVLKDIPIAAFVDSNPKYQGKQLQGIPIVSPQALAGRTEPILISTRPYQSEIENQIRNVLKLPNRIVTLY